MPVANFEAVTLRIDGKQVLESIDWRIEPESHWVVIGPNGGGKSSLLAVAGLHRHPSSGTLSILGSVLGHSDIRPLRGRIGTSSATLSDQLRPGLTAEEVVRCGRFGALEPWWHQYEPSDTDRAHAQLDRVGLSEQCQQTFGTLSSGERQRCLLARALVNDPDLLLLDEPTAGLDLAGRESLLKVLDRLALEHRAPASVLVTHHVEDIPASTTHLLAMTAGQVQACGPIAETLTADLLSELFSLPVHLEHNSGRWSARARQPQQPEHP